MSLLERRTPPDAVAPVSSARGASRGLRVVPRWVLVGAGASVFFVGSLLWLRVLRRRARR